MSLKQLQSSATCTGDGAVKAISALCVDRVGGAGATEADAVITSARATTTQRRIPLLFVIVLPFNFDLTAWPNCGGKVSAFGGSRSGDQVVD